MRAQGVPVRVEVGPRDVQQGACVMARRDRPGKEGKMFGVPMEAGAFVAAVQVPRKTLRQRSLSSRHCSCTSRKLAVSSSHQVAAFHAATCTPARAFPCECVARPHIVAVVVAMVYLCSPHPVCRRGTHCCWSARPSMPRAGTPGRGPAVAAV